MNQAKENGTKYQGNMQRKQVTEKQKKLLKKLGCLTWDKERSLHEASRLITGYLTPTARIQLPNVPMSYVKAKKQYWEQLWSNRQLATGGQRRTLQKLGYDYWNSPYLTWKEAQDWCEMLWKNRSIN